MANIILTAEEDCGKCICKPYIGSDEKNYWFNTKTNVLYTTNCSKSHPKKAKGIFQIGKQIIDQS